jgi:hypothetical protein
MAMRFAVTKGEQTLSELAARLYALGEASATALREAERALVQANPFLRKPAEVAAGTVVTVPPLTRVEPSQEARTLESVAGETVASGLQLALAGAVESFNRSLEAERAQLQDSLATLASPEVKSLARTDPATGAELRQVADAAKARSAEVDAFERSQREAFAQLEEDLKSVLAALADEGAASTPSGAEEHA